MRTYSAARTTLGASDGFDSPGRAIAAKTVFSIHRVAIAGSAVQRRSPYEWRGQLSLPEDCTIVHNSKFDYPGEREIARSIAAALRMELIGMDAPAKIIGRWTGASDRAIWNWLAAKSVPSGIHLIALMRHSDLVKMTVLAAVMRGHSTGSELKEKFKNG